MAHGSQMKFVRRTKQIFPSYFTNSNILEIGSLNVNGTCRVYFENCKYIGIDVVPGKDVDIICSGHEYESDIKFDTIISCEAMEHNFFWKETFQNMINLCRNNSLIIMTCASTTRRQHRTKMNNNCSIKEFHNYYRNLSQKDFEEVFNFSELFDKYEFFDNNIDLYFRGLTK